MSEFVTGDEVYLDDGRIAIFVCKDRDGLIVRPILDEGDDENEPSYGRPLVVRQVYQEPPQERYSAEVARLREQQAALVEKDPETFILFGGWSKNGSTGIRLANVRDLKLVKALVSEAFREVAARRR